MWQFARAVEGHRRGLPRARRADHRRQRQPLQRDRRQRHLSDAGHRRRRPARARRSRARAAVSRDPGDVDRAARRGSRRARRQRVSEAGARPGARRAAGARSRRRARAAGSARRRWPTSGWSARRTTVPTAAWRSTLAECCFDTGGIGAEVSIDAVDVVARSRASNDAAALFGESASRVVVSASRRRRHRGAGAGGGGGRAGAGRSGETGGNRLRIAVGGRSVDRSAGRRRRAWSSVDRRSNSVACAKTGRPDEHARQVQGRVRRLRHLRSPRSGQHDLPRAVRAAAPRAGERRHRRVGRRAGPVSRGDGLRRRHLRRRDAGARCRADWRSATSATRRPARASCRTRSRS